MLAPVKGIYCKLKYVSWGYAGAIKHPWLQPEVFDRLLNVDKRVRSETGGQGRLLIWDALRSIETQKHIFNKERARIGSLHPSLSQDEIDRIVSQFVRVPSIERPPPHATGGAVDVTIWIDNSDETLGKFDDFSEFGRADFFQTHQPENDWERQASERRAVLQDAMLREGFAGIDEEWWHYEYGTRYWAEKTQNDCLFDSIIDPPVVDAIALRGPLTPVRQPLVSHGVAQVFPTAEHRNRSLRGEIESSYYARTRHPNEQQVAHLLRAMLGSGDAILTPSGISAAIAAVWGHMRPGGRLVIDATAYYETRNALRALSKDLHWTIAEIDLSNTAVISNEHLQGVDVIFCDHPRNWILTSPNLSALKNVAESFGARLIVDTSVQPLQGLLERGLADIQVLSLSKYPSAGETIGGAIIGSSETLVPIRKICTSLGLVLSPESAGTLLSHLRTLDDRLVVVSEKTGAVAKYLRALPFVEDVRIPDLANVGALSGGQLTFKVPITVAQRAEDIVAAQALDERFPFAFGCTFGALFTTFEHFHARNTDQRQASEASEYIQEGVIRLGLGHEPASLILSALDFVLHAAKLD